MNMPENREYMAEIMFETFNVSGLYIAMQAALALCASWTSKNSKAGHSLTGAVIDSGDGVTHVIPVYEGNCIGSSIKSIPLAGRDITKFVQELMQEREPTIPRDDRMEVAKRVKERFCYSCPDIVKEFRKYETEPDKWIKTYEGEVSRTKEKWSCNVGYERFLGPEIFFNPEILDKNYTKSLPELVDNSIQTSPIDCRRALYKNICLSGGSTMFKDFGRRLKRDIQKFADTRCKESERISGHKPKPIEVNVVSHQFQRYAVWFGGSIMSQTPEFFSAAHSKAEYDELGPKICRTNAVCQGI